MSDSTRFTIHMITVTRESGFGSLVTFKNWLKEYWTGELQGHTSVGLVVNNGHFDEDFEGEITFLSPDNEDVTVEVVEEEWTDSDHVQRSKRIRLDSADAAKVHDQLMWLCIDCFPSYAWTHKMA